MAGAHDITKLPRWAQDRISLLERDLADAREQLMAGEADSDTIANPNSEAPRPLGRGASVQFGTERWQKFTVRLRENGTLDVMGDDMIWVHPQAGNVVVIRNERG
jgi:hypothetical protein